jgi:uncharacterized membrane protein YoaK (UPF0700 family)
MTVQAVIILAAVVFFIVGVVVGILTERYGR